jgi:hypothetical protein
MESMKEEAVANQCNCSIALDIATTKGMLSSFLGIVFHFWSSTKNKMIVYSPDMIEIDSAHTGDNIR